MITITKDKKVISKFIENMGKSSDTFRYFNKRSVDAIDNHLLTCVFNEENINYPIGYAHIDYDGEKFWFGVCVSDGFSGRGIGKELSKYIISEYFKMKEQDLFLSVDKVNDVAIRMYSKLGFSVETEMPNYFIMVKKYE